MCSESVSPAYVWRLVAHAFCMEVLMNNPMKEAPVNKLMLKMGTPIILSMMKQALYNIVDSAFVSNMGANGEMALNALTLAFPVQVLLIALGIGTGVGMNVVFASPFANMFGLAGETEDICIAAMRIVSISFLFAGFNISFQGIYQALNAGPQSLVISILRQFVLVIPVAFVFSNLVIAGTTFKSIIWFTFIIAEMLTALIGYFMLNRIVKNSLTFRAI